MPEKPLKTASGGVSGVLLDVVVLRTDKAAPAPSRGVRIFFMVSPLDGLENQKKRPAKGAVIGGGWLTVMESYRYLGFLREFARITRHDAAKASCATKHANAIEKKSK